MLAKSWMVITVQLMLSSKFVDFLMVLSKVTKVKEDVDTP